MKIKKNSWIHKKINKLHKINKMKEDIHQKLIN